MDKPKIFLIVNPCSGTGKMKRELFGVVEVLTRGGYSVTVYPTASRGDATRVVEELPDEYKTVVCCGGDGTLNEVITGVIKGEKKVSIGYIPSGTLNEWSSGLGISKNIKKAAEDILTGKEVPLDIGRIGNSYFTYTASFGAFTSASYSAPQDVKNILGQVAYVLEGIKSLGNIKPLSLTFKADDKVYSGNYLFGAVANSMSVGGIIKLNHASVDLSDGYFEVVLIETPDSIAELNDIIDGILKKDLNRKKISQFKAKRIAVTDHTGIDWTLDGEYMHGSEKLLIENMNKAINFIIPEK